MELYYSVRVIFKSVRMQVMRPRGAFISVGDCTSSEKDLLLLNTCRSGSLLDGDKLLLQCFIK